jgi:hypothetical protein
MLGRWPAAATQENNDKALQAAARVRPCKRSNRRSNLCRSGPRQHGATRYRSPAMHRPAALFLAALPLLVQADPTPAQRATAARLTA